VFQTCDWETQNVEAQRHQGDEQHHRLPLSLRQARGAARRPAKDLDRQRFLPGQVGDQADDHPDGGDGEAGVVAAGLGHAAHDHRRQERRGAERRAVDLEGDGAASVVAVVEGRPPAASG
jgi:hypothetical protein